MDLEMGPPNLKLCGIPLSPLLPTPSCVTKMFKLLFCGKRQFLKKQNNAKGLSECQCKFPFVFWLKMGRTLSSSINNHTLELHRETQTDNENKSYVLTLKLLFLPLVPCDLCREILKRFPPPLPPPPPQKKKKFKFYIKITILSWKWPQRQHNIILMAIFYLKMCFQETAY